MQVTTAKQGRSCRIYGHKIIFMVINIKKVANLVKTCYSTVNRSKSCVDF